MSCKDEVQREKIQSQPKKEKTFSLVEIERLAFWKSYADHQYLTDKELKELEKSNATLEENNSNPQLLKKLDSLKIVKDTELLQKRFENSNQPENDFLDQNRTIQFCYSFGDIKQTNSIAIKVEIGEEIITKAIDFGGWHFIGLILEDIDNDGIKEIIVLEYTYFMNGDHYVMTILKLKK